MSVSDIWLIELITSDPVMDLIKPLMIAFLILYMIYLQAKPRIQSSDKVQL